MFTCTETATGGMTNPVFIIRCFRLVGDMGNCVKDELLSSGGGGVTDLLASLSDLGFPLLAFAVALLSILLTRFRTFGVGLFDTGRFVNMHGTASGDCFLPSVK